MIFKSIIDFYQLSDNFFCHLKKNELFKSWLMTWKVDVENNIKLNRSVSLVTAEKLIKYHMKPFHW